MGIEIDTQNYARKFPNYPSVIKDRKTKWVHGVWMIGNNFRNKRGYYGEYPPSFLNRVGALIPNPKTVLHLFSGVVDKGTWGQIKETTLDIREDLQPDIVTDAHKMSEVISPNSFDLIVADPPYSDEDAKHYGSPMISRNKVVAQCYSILQQGGLLCWLDQAFPMYRKEELKLIGTIGIWRSTNHRFRGLSIFRKL